MKDYCKPFQIQQMTTYHFQINPYGCRTPWPMVPHRTRKFKAHEKAKMLAILAATFYKAEVRLTTGKHPSVENGEYFRSPVVR
jgi:hypothetical protein